MFDFIHKYRRVVQIFLALAMLPVAFVGIDAFQNSASADEAARVGKHKITLQQLEEAVRQRADQVRARQGGAVDNKVFQSPEFRQSVLNSLIEEQLLQQETQRLGLSASDALLQDYIAQIPDFQENGKFSSAKYDSVLRDQGLKPGDFENNVRRNLNLQMLVGGVAGTSQGSKTQLEQIIAAEGQERQVSFALIPAQDYAKSVSVSDDEVKKFYDSNAPKFQLPERVKVAYVVLSDPKVAAKAAGDFDRMVYEQADSYKEVAQALNLKIETSDWISANGQGAQGILANPKILQAIFSAESLNEKKNSKAIEIAPNVFISARVTEYQKASPQPFESVAADIRKFLLTKAAVDKAAKDGEARLTDLKAGKAVASLKWSPVKTISLLQPNGLGAEAVQRITATDVSQLPAYTGTPAGGAGYVLFKITAVKAGGALPEAARAQIGQVYRQFVQQADIASLMVALREQHPVRISQRAIENTTDSK